MKLEIKRSIKKETLRVVHTKITQVPKNKIKKLSERPITNENIVCREKEVSEIRNFLIKAIEERTNKNLYISGCPGTGKTAVVTDILQSLQMKNKCTFHLVTCLDFARASAVFPEIWKKLSNREESNSDQASTEIERYLQVRKKSSRALVLVLDEIDELQNSEMRILSKIFKWVQLASCRLVIVGIANTMNLTEDGLVDVTLESYRPHHIKFAPYNCQEIESIITAKIKVALTPSQKQAVVLCSMKVAGKSGDVRVAIELYKRATTLSEEDQVALLRAEPNITTTSSEKEPSTSELLCMRRSRSLIPSLPGIDHVSRAIKEIEKVNTPYENIRNGDNENSKLPLHHKLVLCSLLVMSKQKNTGSMTLGQLYDKYSKVCDSKGIETFGMSHLVHICDLLDSRALMRVRPHKDIRQKRITMNLDEVGIRGALADDALFSSII